MRLVTILTLVLPLLLVSVVPFSSIPWSAEAFAQEAERLDVRPEGHPLPAKGPLISELREDIPGTSGQTVIRIYEDQAGTRIREFSANGAVYQVEVKPMGMPPYYLIDSKGRGLFDTLLGGNQPKLVIPQWVLMRF